MNQTLPNAPLSLIDLHFLQVLGELPSFTAAAQRLHITQSALTRRVQTMEARLGVRLFERTTRSVRPTEAAKFLMKQSSQVLEDVGRLLDDFQRDHGSGPKRIRVGVSSTVCLAHLPGLFSKNLKEIPDLQPILDRQSSRLLIDQLVEGRMDLAVLCPPARLPRTLRVAHQFRDDFTIIAPVSLSVPDLRPPTAAYREWLGSLMWMGMGGESETSQQLNHWLRGQKLALNPRMLLEDFDLMIHLAATGLGVAMVPNRAVAAFPRRHALQRLPWPERFSRDLVVVARRDRNPHELIKAFVEGILF